MAFEDVNTQTWFLLEAVGERETAEAGAYDQDAHGLVRMECVEAVRVCCANATDGRL